MALQKRKLLVHPNTLLISVAFHSRLIRKVTTATEPLTGVYHREQRAGE
jgi:hypothetical protein